MKTMSGNAQSGFARPRRPLAYALAAIALPALGLLGCAEPMVKPQLVVVAPAPVPANAASVLDVEATADSVPAAQVVPDTSSPPGSGGPEVFAAAQQDPLPSASPVSTPPDTTEGYQTIGGILAEVNGKPIFSDDIILTTRNMLRGAAKQQPTLEAFLREARRILEAELKIQIEDDLRRFVAERNISSKDRRQALLGATAYRANLVTAAGGSEARARELALIQDGMSLEKLVEDTENRFLVSIFLRTVIMPRARPSEAEIREYYLRHPELFSGQGKGEAEFLVIELVAAAGSSAGDLDARAQEIHRLASEGGDFAQLAQEHNDNPVYKQNAGAVPGSPLGRGDFRWAAVDEAVWSTPPGQITPVITDDGGRRRFIVKVLRRSEANVISFEQAQAGIRDRILKQRLDQLMSQYLLEAQRYAAVTPADQIERNLQTALEVVAQKYGQWRDE